MNITSIDTLTFDWFTSAPSYIPMGIGEEIKDKNQNRLLGLDTNEKLIHISHFAYLVFAAIQDNTELTNSFQLFKATYTNPKEKNKHLMLIKDLTEDKTSYMQLLIQDVFKQLSSIKLKIVPMDKTSLAYTSEGVYLGLEMSKEIPESHISIDEMALVIKLCYSQKSNKLFMHNKKDSSFTSKIKNLFNHFKSTSDNIQNKGWNLSTIGGLVDSTGTHITISYSFYNQFHQKDKKIEKILDETINNFFINMDLFLINPETRNTKKAIQ